MSDLVKMSDIINIYNTYDSEEAREQVMKLLSINAVIIPDNATNGDMINALFPNAMNIRVDGGYPLNYIIEGEWHRNLKDWWNAPYKENKE